MNRSVSRHRRSAPADAVPTDAPQRLAASGEGPDAQQHRVDRAHQPLTANVPETLTPAGSADGFSRAAAAEGEPVVSPSDLLRLHAEDLIDRLQAWAGDLDAREAQLNARLALQEHRERQFRLWSQARRAETEQAHRDAQRLNQHLQAEARRIALTEPLDESDSTRADMELTLRGVKPLPGQHP